MHQQTPQAIIVVVFCSITAITASGIKLPEMPPPLGGVPPPGGLIAPGSLTAAACKDLSTFCTIAKANGYCTSKKQRAIAFVTARCRKSCGFCKAKLQSDCRDNDDYCSLPDAPNDCKSTDAYVKKFMQKNCPKLCGFCKPKVPCFDQEKTSTCQNYMKKGYCDNIKFRNYFMANCKKTCQFCDIDKTYPCGISKVRQRSGPNQIIGGKTATKGAWPWQVAFYSNNKFICGGTLVNRRFIVSAAHCFKSKDVSIYRVVLGEHNRNLAEGTEQIVRPKNIIIHPGYIPRVANDIAIVELEKDAMLSTYITTACLPQVDERVAPGTKCYMSGWGRRLITLDSATVLQEAPMTILSHDECAKQNKNTDRQVLSTMICAKNENNFWTSGCHGDSGGPLVCENKQGKMVLHGAVSWGSNTCDALEHHTVFTRITSFITWIKRNTKM